MEGMGKINYFSKSPCERNNIYIDVIIVDIYIKSRIH